MDCFKMKLIYGLYVLRKYVKEQKDHKDEISRASGSALDKVREETLALRQVLFWSSNLNFLSFYIFFILFIICLANLGADHLTFEKPVSVIDIPPTPFLFFGVNRKTIFFA